MRHGIAVKKVIEVIYISFWDNVYIEVIYS